MKQNVGSIDKTVRVLIAIALVVGGYLSKIWVLYLLAGVVFLTAVTGFCGAYSLFGINTCKTENVKPKAEKQTKKKK